MEPTLTPPAPLLANLRGEFLIDPELAFLNHGSFGAVPRVVVEEQNQWRRQIETDPIQTLHRRGPQLIAEAKGAIGAWLEMNPADFGLVTNATEGINCVLRSLKFSAGDELLTTGHVYNAVRQAMTFVAHRAGATYREIEIPPPIASPDAIANAVLSAIGRRTRLVVIDHISSATALILPVERIVEECAKMGVDVLIDGAHAPGMVELNVSKISAAYYAGNLHKWGCAPKGSAFLWVRRDRQAEIHPLIVSHHYGQGMEKEFSWQGTRDISAWLAVPRAIEWMGRIGWARVMAHNHAMAAWVNQMLCRRWNVSAISPADGSMLGSMAAVPLPPPLDRLTPQQSEELQVTLHDRWKIEVPIMVWGGRSYARVCCQIYNVAEDYVRLAETIERLARQA
ncbi:MAG TPA: aminotransferase class V-fold PLP-dependent enzyme [Tepidisphaeraceae bacterium]|nr:aminotransferase class V-fold PLP-dependent enzyme [Tepidisphaeraceae bacterium]